MRAELTRIGVQELTTVEAVDACFQEAEEGTMVLIVNSVCGCAAANARPAVSLAMQAPVQPDRYATVFAGQDLQATSKAREYMMGIPPSSPFIALFKNADPVFVLERRHIEGRSASAIAMDLVHAYNKYCGDGAATNGAEKSGAERPEVEAKQHPDLPSTFRSIL